MAGGTKMTLYQYENSVPGSDLGSILKTIDEIINYGGANNVSIQYEYNDRGKISKEITTGDSDLVREFTYNSIDELDTELIYYKERKIKKTYGYDLTNYRLLTAAVEVIS